MQNKHNNKMQTRSQTKPPCYEVNIDFNEASAAWKANKKSIGNGCYKYTCLLCNRAPQKDSTYCTQHMKQQQISK